MLNQQVYGMVPLRNPNWSNPSLERYRQITGSNVADYPVKEETKTYYDFFFADDMTGIKNRPNDQKKAHESLKSTLDRYTNVPEGYLRGSMAEEKKRLAKKFDDAQYNYGEYTKNHGEYQKLVDDLEKALTSQVAHDTEWYSDLADIGELCESCGISDTPTLVELLTSDNAFIIDTDHPVVWLVYPIDDVDTDDGGFDLDPSVTPYLLVPTDQAPVVAVSNNDNDEMKKLLEIRKLCHEANIEPPTDLQAKISQQIPSVKTKLNDNTHHVVQANKVITKTSHLTVSW